MKSLLIGIGNPLRGDDGIGPFLAQNLESEASPELQIRAVHQLSPELAADLIQVERVLFIDAEVASGVATVPTLQVLQSAQIEPLCSGLSHHATPQQLLAMAQALFHRCPRATLLRVPAFNFSYTTGFSKSLQDQIPSAQHLLRQWLVAPAELPAPCTN